MRFPKALVGLFLLICVIAGTVRCEEAFRGFGGIGGGFAGAPEQLARLVLLIVESDTAKKDLGLTADQTTKLDTIGKQVLGSSGASRRDLSSLSDEDRKKMLEALQRRREAIAAFRKNLETILMAEQLARLDEICLQTRGIEALADPGIIKQLDIQPNQVKEFIKIRDEANIKLEEIIRGSSDSLKRRELQVETAGKVMAVLTDAQKSKFEKMKGKKIEIHLGRTRSKTRS